MIKPDFDLRRLSERGLNNLVRVTAADVFFQNLNACLLREALARREDVQTDGSFSFDLPADVRAMVTKLRDLTILFETQAALVLPSWERVDLEAMAAFTGEVALAIFSLSCPERPE